MGKKKKRKPLKKKTSLEKSRNRKAWQPSGDFRTKLNQALAFHKQGKLQKAAILYQEILDNDPNHPDALHLLGVIMTGQGNFRMGIELISRAIQNFPASEIMYTNLGNALSNAGRFQEAVDAYQKALDINPRFFDAYNNLGSTTKRMGKPLEAIRYYEKALQVKPDAAGTYSDMGNILIEIGRINKALQCYTASINLNPSNAKAYNNMASALKAQERYAEAIDYYCKAVETDHHYAEAFNNLGATIADIGKPDEAIKYFQKALEIRPDFPLARINLYYATQRTCNWHQVDALNEEIDKITAQALEEGFCPLEDPFLNLARHAVPELNFAVARAWSKKVARTMSETKANFVFGRTANVGNKITLGYISHNFRNHAMAHLMSRVFESHNRDTFKVHGYSCGEDDNSEYRNRIQNGCDKFVDIRELNHLDAAKQIYTDRVDILIDLMGYTRGGRIEIAALRPAPVQMRYMGMAGTTGADFFDYLIADRIVVPREQTPYYSEKLIYLPECYQVNDDRQAIADVRFDRKTCGLPEEGFVFCSFNQALKLDSVMFETWIKILTKVPDSILWLQAGSAAGEQHLLKEARNRGLEEKRIVFAPKLSKAEHLARLQLADLALDTRLVNGAATTSDALWAGLPVITYRGKHFSSRMSASILSAIGLSDLVTNGLDAYAKLAIHLARNPAAIESVRQRLRANLKTKPLFNTRHQVANLEAAYQKAWQIYVSGQQPQLIEIGR